ncbi:uncharacterized protein LOC111085280 isoform X1 [Limulus polyphemus]|uniref:Uncharacterized protein LOC111085280 isoform X1 n=1 Tax=Limulus polyphemus TaxID=6850 RepID=A0ABM1S592_LIMPO|nr:uncharacterized protein LOC111085280 isoform X1 [Limulus polyphemus]
MRLKILYLFHVIVASAGGQLSSKQQQEQCTLQTFHQCLTSLQSVTQASDLNLIASKDELDAACRELEKSVRCVDDHKKRCFSDTQRRVFNQVVAGARQFIKELCVSSEVQKEYLRHALCFRNISVAEDKCAPTSRHTLWLSENVKENENVEESLRKTCCAFTEFVRCRYAYVSADCGHEAGTFFKRHLERISGPLIHEHCAAYTFDMEACMPGGFASLLKTNPLILLLPLVMLART